LLQIGLATKRKCFTTAARAYISIAIHILFIDAFRKKLFTAGAEMLSFLSGAPAVKQKNRNLFTATP
jgi:hypothetical protein